MFGNLPHNDWQVKWITSVQCCGGKPVLVWTWIVPDKPPPEQVLWRCSKHCPAGTVCWRRWWCPWGAVWESSLMLKDTQTNARMPTFHWRSWQVPAVQKWKGQQPQQPACILISSFHFCDVIIADWRTSSPLLWWFVFEISEGNIRYFSVEDPWYTFLPCCLLEYLYFGDVILTRLHCSKCVRGPHLFEKCLKSRNTPFI